MAPAANQWLSGKEAEPDNGAVRYQVQSMTERLLAGDNKESKYSAIYGAVAKANGRLATKCRLTIRGQSQLYHIHQ